MQQAQRWCQDCERYTLHQRPHFETHWGCILTFITGCFFLPVWIVIAMAQSGGKWRCQVCGASESLAREPRMKPVASGADEDLACPPLLERFEGAFWAVRDSVEAGFKEAVRLVVNGYRGLPEWAKPIVWGLGIAVGVIGLVALIRASL